MILLSAIVGAIFMFMGLLWSVEKGRVGWLFAFLVGLVVACVVVSLAATA